MKPLLSILLLPLFLAFQTELVSTAVSCIGPDENPVDWFIVYKVPRLREATPHFRSGLGMMYLDEAHPEWMTLEEPITGNSHPIHFTLKQIYDMAISGKPKDKVYLMYNDKIPNSRHSPNKAHAKGDLCFDDNSGFWLVHSVPSFPADPSKVQSPTYPESGTVYGQMFMCVTFGIDQLDAIGGQLSLMDPQVYSHHVSPHFERAAPRLWSLLRGGRSARGSGRRGKMDHSKSEVLISKGGRRFVSFAKSKNYGKDLYQDLVAPGLGSNLLVQTWTKSNGNVQSSCSTEYSTPLRGPQVCLLRGRQFSMPDSESFWITTRRHHTAPTRETRSYNDDGASVPTTSPDDLSTSLDQVKNVLSLDVGGSKFKDTLDHSKWAITDPGNATERGCWPSEDCEDSDGTTDEAKSGQIEEEESVGDASKAKVDELWTCIGDMNRQKSQASRGGGTLCFGDREVWREFRRIVGSVEDCGGSEEEEKEEEEEDKSTRRYP